MKSERKAETEEMKWTTGRIQFQGGSMIEGNQRLFHWGLGLLGMMLFIAGAILIVALQAEGAPPASKQFLFFYPVKTFEGGTARFYEYRTGDGITIKYFILQSSDGVIRAAFDACDVCWREGKGYFQRGDFMICKNCGQRFASVRINEVRGGCNPAPLRREIKAGNIVIKASDLLEGSRYFEFARKG
jgi:uncharacterized membrane protein